MNNVDLKRMNVNRFCKCIIVTILLALLVCCSKEKLDGVSTDFDKKTSSYKLINSFYFL